MRLSKILLILVCFLFNLYATVYFCRADGSAASKAAATGPTSDATKCMSMATFNAQTFSAGDTVKFSATGGSYTATLTVPSGGSAGNYIVYTGIPSDTPLVDLSGNASSANAVYATSKSYIKIRLMKLKGSGGSGVIRLEGSSGAEGYTVVIDTVNILSNYGSSTGGHDGISLDNTAQTIITGSIARGCRADPPGAGSDQCLTTHTSSKAKWYGGEMHDSKILCQAVGDSRIEIYNVVAELDGGTVSGFDGDTLPLVQYIGGGSF